MIANNGDLYIAASDDSSLYVVEIQTGLVSARDFGFKAWDSPSNAFTTYHGMAALQIYSTKDHPGDDLVGLAVLNESEWQQTVDISRSQIGYTTTMGAISDCVVYLVRAAGRNNANGIIYNTSHNPASDDGYVRTQVDIDDWMCGFAAGYQSGYLMIGCDAMRTTETMLLFYKVSDKALPRTFCAASSTTTPQSTASHTISSTPSPSLTHRSSEPVSTPGSTAPFSSLSQSSLSTSTSMQTASSRTDTASTRQQLASSVSPTADRSSSSSRSITGPMRTDTTKSSTSTSTSNTGAASSNPTPSTSSTGGSTSTAVTDISTTSSTVTSTSLTSATGQNSPSAKGGGDNFFLLVGVSLGAVVLVALFFLWLWYRRVKTRVSHDLDDYDQLNLLTVSVKQGTQSVDDIEHDPDVVAALTQTVTNSSKAHRVHSAAQLQRRLAAAIAQQDHSAISAAIAAGASAFAVNAAGQRPLASFISTPWFSVHTAQQCLKALIGHIPTAHFDWRTDEDTPALHAAVVFGNFRALEALLTLGAPVDMLNSVHETAFITACQRSNADSLALMLDLQPPSLKQLCMLDSKGYTCLHWAVLVGALDCIRVLLKRCPPELVDVARSCTDETAVHVAARENNPEALELMLLVQPLEIHPLLFEPNECGETIEDIAQKSNATEMLALLAATKRTLSRPGEKEATTIHRVRTTRNQSRWRRNTKTSSK